MKIFITLFTVVFFISCSYKEEAPALPEEQTKQEVNIIENTPAQEDAEESIPQERMLIINKDPFSKRQTTEQEPYADSQYEEKTPAKKLFSFEQNKEEIEDENKELTKEQQLLQAVRDENFNRVKALIKDGANVNAEVEILSGFNDCTNEYGIIISTPLAEAAKSGNKEIATFLLNNGADVNKGSFSKEEDYICEDETPLFIAVSKGDKALTQLFIEHKADVNRDYSFCGGDCADEESATPLIKAAEMGYKDIAELLLKAKADVNKEVIREDTISITPLWTAVNKKNNEIADLLLKYGANDMSAAEERIDLLPALIKNGGDINAEISFPEKERLLHRMVYNSNKEGVKKLLELGADVNVKNNAAETPLFKANNNDIAKMLTDAGANVNEKNIFGKTPLFDIYDLETIKFLIDAGADVNAQSETGETPLMDAAFGGNIVRVKILLDAGADANIKDNEGKTALTFADKTHQWEIINLLKQYTVK